MLRISKTDAVLGYNITPTKQRIVQTLADFEMNQKHAKVHIESEPIRILIDQSQCFNEAGLKDLAAFGDETAQLGKQAAAEFIDRTVSEGNTLAAIASKADAVAEIAASNFIQTYDFNIDFIPKSRPKFEMVGGNVDISVDEGYVNIYTKANKPEVDVEVGNVEFYMKQHPEIHFSYEGKEIDLKV